MTDFGGRLRQAREERGISLRQIAANTKISVSSLEALERNDVSKLPGGIFSRAFVRSYAAEVGLDPDETVHEFLDRFPGEPVPEPPIHVPTEAENVDEAQRRAAGLAVRAILAVLVVGAIFAYFAFRGGDGASTAASPVAAERPEVATTPGPAQPAAAPAVDDVLRATGPMKLELHPSGPCWVKLTVDGEDAFAKLMQAGQKETVTVQTVAVLSIGDAGAFEFSVDGRPGRKLGSSGEVRTARITRETLPEYLR